MNKIIKAKKIRLDKKSIKLRLHVIEALKKYKRGHIGAAFSCIDIIRVIYDKYLFSKKKKIGDFVLSKGHGCLALYSVLYDKGIISKNTLTSFTGSNSILGGHPEHFVPTINFSTGSLGHGFAFAAGMSVADKIRSINKKIFVLLGDGEINEGSIWETALSVKKHNLKNLITLVDYNKMQSYGSMKEVINLHPLKKKWESFGFKVLEINGHSINEIKKSINFAVKHKTKPIVIICHTVKGKGLKTAENNPAWHYKSNLETEELNQMEKILYNEKRLA